MFKIWLKKVFGSEVQAKLRRLFSIVLPIFITQVAIMGMSFFDATMSGHAGATQLAGTSIGGNIWMPIFTAMNGILVAATPITAQLLGADRKKEIAPFIRQGLLLAFVLGCLVLVAGFVFLSPLLHGMRLEAEVVRVAIYYLASIGLGIIPFFMATALRSLVDTLGGTRLTMKIYLLALPVNGVLNYLLIFGKLGLPPLGGVGAGIATGITYWLVFSLFVLVVCKVPRYQEYHIFQGRFTFSWPLLKEYLQVGIPIGLAIFMETSIFGVVALFVAKFGTAVIAAHQTAMSFSSLMYTIPLSMSLGLTIVIGVSVGAGAYTTAEQYGNVAMACNWTGSLFLMVGVYVLRPVIAGLYSNEAQVVELATHFLFYSCFFQLLDGVAAPIQGILRGYKDVRATFYSSLLAYWGICLPLGLFLDYGLGHGAFAYWQSLDIGIFCSAFILLTRLFWLRRSLRRQEQS